ncbi:MAG: hypothetical protein ACI4TC_02405 [Kiritimatiellia bacterium]
MRSCLFAIVVVLSAAVFAAPVEVSQLPMWEQIDTEVSTNCLFRVNRNPIEDLTFSLTMSATSSNNVQVAFGRDSDANGTLTVMETGLVVGWDCGHWVMRAPDVAPIVAEAATTGSTKTLTFSLHIVDFRAQRLLCEENDHLLEWPLPDPIPSWLFNPSWNLLRVTVRGVDVPNETFRAKVNVNGTNIIVR